MEDTFFASHIFGGHMDVNCKASLQTLNVFFLPEMGYKHIIPKA